MIFQVRSELVTFNPEPSNVRPACFYLLLYSWNLNSVGDYIWKYAYEWHADKGGLAGYMEWSEKVLAE